MCCSNFFAALRVGEITASPAKPQQNNTRLQYQIFLLKNRRRETEAIKLHMVHFKHSDTSNPVETFIYRDKPVCAVSLLLDYLKSRGSAPSPLFCSADLTPVSRSDFSRYLNMALDFCNLDRSRYKLHSFRICAASWGAAKGLSDAQIRAFGRWKSNAFLRYIRTPSLGSL